MFSYLFKILTLSLLKKIRCPHFSAHDLRRTCRSLLAEQGTPGHVAERYLNHKLKGVEGIYDRYDYFNERAEALKILSTKLNPIIDGLSN